MEIDLATPAIKHRNWVGFNPLGYACVGAEIE